MPILILLYPVTAHVILDFNSVRLNVPVIVPILNLYPVIAHVIIGLNLVPVNAPVSVFTQWMQYKVYTCTLWVEKFLFLLLRDCL